MKQVEDHSIFVHQGNMEYCDGGHISALAVHPKQFAYSPNIKLYPSSNSEPYSITSKGIRIRLQVVGTDTAVLDCGPADQPLTRFCLPLIRVDDAEDVVARDIYRPYIAVGRERRLNGVWRTIFLPRTIRTQDEEPYFKNKSMIRCWIRSLEMVG